MEVIANIFSELIAVWKEMWKAIYPIMQRMLSFSLWVLAAIIVLPCVYVAGNIYPMWEKWGDNL